MIGCAVLGVSANARAAVLFNDTSTTVAGADNATNTTYIASAFTTGSAANSLTASLLLQQIVSGTDTVSVYSSSTFTPNAVVGALTASGTPSSSSAGLVTFTGTGLGLSSGTTYWLVLHSTGSVAWSYSGDSTLTDAWASSTDSGSTWTSTGDSYPYVYSVSDTVAVPEPTSLVALGGVAGITLRRRRRA
jgi:hypothetical protein